MSRVDYTMSFSAWASPNVSPNVVVDKRLIALSPNWKLTLFFVIH